MQRIQTPEMQGLGLPFCSAVRVGDMLYMSGVLGNLPGGLTLAPGGLVAEARQTMDNIGAVLRHCGAGVQRLPEAKTLFIFGTIARREGMRIAFRSGQRSIAP